MRLLPFAMLLCACATAAHGDFDPVDAVDADEEP